MLKIPVNKLCHHKKFTTSVIWKASAFSLINKTSDSNWISPSTATFLKQKRTFLYQWYKNVNYW